eukprot:s4_g25.t1
MKEYEMSVTSLKWRISPISGLQIPKAAMFSDATARNYQLKCSKLRIHILYCNHCRSSFVKQGINSLP